MKIDPTTGCNLGTAETLIDPQVEVPRFAATVVAPPRGTPDYYPLKLLIDILGSGNSSRFEQNIVRQGLAANAYVGLNNYQGASILYSVALPNSGDSVEKMSQLIQTELDKVRKDGVTVAELARVKKQTLVNAITSFRESALDSAEWLQDYTLTFGDPNSIETDLAKYQAVTAADIQRVAQTYLCDKPMNIQTVLPSGKEQLSASPVSLVQPAALSEASQVATSQPVTKTLDVLNRKRKPWLACPPTWSTAPGHPRRSVNSRVTFHPLTPSNWTTA